MSGKWYTNEFKKEAFKQVIERGYTVREAAKRLDVSAHSLYKWVKAVKPDILMSRPPRCSTPVSTWRQHSSCNRDRPRPGRL